MSYLIFMFLVRQCFGDSSLDALEGRIVNGYKVEISVYPHSVFLNFETHAKKTCGSTLITDQTVITSAACVDEIVDLNDEITAFLGASFPIDASVRRHVVLFSTHPKYNDESGKFNLGVCFLNKAVPLTKLIQKIPIVTQVPETDDVLYTSGWGKTHPRKFPDYSNRRPLKASKQKLLSMKDCQMVTGRKKTPAIWCTQSISGFHYHGDLGNGLVTADKRLLAIVSYMVNDFTVYSDVMMQQVWINNTIGDLLKKFCKKRMHLNN